MEKLGTWILEQLEYNAWSQAELARRANISQPTLSRIISGTQSAGPDACKAIAHALQEPPEKVFRLAGLLPSLPPAVEEEQEIIGILRSLPPNVRDTVVTQLRALAARTPPPMAPMSEDIYEPNADYEYPVMSDEELERELLLEFNKLPDEWQQEALEEVKRLQRLSTLTVRFVGEEEEEEERIPSD